MLVCTRSSRWLSRAQRKPSCQLIAISLALLLGTYAHVAVSPKPASVLLNFVSGHAVRQLEVLRNEEDGTERGSLLWLLDHTRTPAGGRLIRSWVAHPLTDGDAIAGRLDAVQELSRAEADHSGARLAGYSRVYCVAWFFLACAHNWIMPSAACAVTQPARHLPLLLANLWFEDLSTVKAHKAVTSVPTQIDAHPLIKAPSTS